MSKKIGKRKQAPTAQKGFVRITETQFNLMKKNMYNDCLADAAENAMATVLLVSVCVLVNDFGKLMKKETRLQNFAELFKQYSEKINCPTPLMLAAEDEFKRKTNMEFVKDEQ